MDLRQVPILKIEIEGIKHSVAHMLTDHQHELSELIKQSMTKAIADYDLDGAVRGAVHSSINKAIERYFEYGDGNKAIEQVIDEAFSKK